MKLSKANIRSALMVAETCTRASEILGCTRSYLANYMRRTNDTELRALYDAVKRRDLDACDTKPVAQQPGECEDAP